MKYVLKHKYSQVAFTITRPEPNPRLENILPLYDGNNVVTQRQAVGNFTVGRYLYNISIENIKCYNQIYRALKKFGQWRLLVLGAKFFKKLEEILLRMTCG